MDEYSKGDELVKPRIPQSLNTGAKKIVKARKKQLEEFNAKTREEIDKCNDKIKSLQQVVSLINQAQIEANVKRLHTKLDFMKEKPKAKKKKDGTEKALSKKKLDKVIDKTKNKMKKLTATTNEVLKQIKTLEHHVTKDKKDLENIRDSINMFASQVIDEHHEIEYLNTMASKRGADTRTPNGKGMELITSVFRLNKFALDTKPTSSTKGKGRSKKKSKSNDKG